MLTERIRERHGFHRVGNVYRSHIEGDIPGEGLRVDVIPSSPPFALSFSVYAWIAGTLSVQMTVYTEDGLHTLIDLIFGQFQISNLRSR